MGTLANLESASNGGGGLSSVLSSENRDFLITPSKDKVSVKDIEGNILGLYFGANWFSKCENFTPVLASLYYQLKEKVANFEVVFISSDEDQTSFDHFHGTMPWPAIPFCDLKSKRSLTHKFQIEGIPSLIILSPSGELIHTEGVEFIYRYGWRAFPFTSERIAELEAEEKAKHASQTLENLLLFEGRDYVMSHTGQVPISSLVGKTVGLYFSAHRCPPCTKFTSRLVPIYNILKEKNEEFEIVFVSLDRDEAGYSECYSDMPWLALPYNIDFSKSLSRYFDVQGIPTLVIIGPDGKTVTKEGRHLINLHSEMAFPFTEAQLRFLHNKMDEEAKSYPSSFNHVGHRHVLKLVSENSGGGPFICCECEEQGLGWAYQCLGCGYEIHLKCVRGVGGDETSQRQMPAAVESAVVESICALNSSGL